MEKYETMFGENIISLNTLKIQCFFSFIRRLSVSALYSVCWDLFFMLVLKSVNDCTIIVPEKLSVKEAP